MALKKSESYREDSAGMRESQQLEWKEAWRVLPEGWTAETLLAGHSSRPFNPLVAAAFFRAGEIEAWGRGIQRIQEACEAAGTPSPAIRCDACDYRFEFTFSAEYVAAVRPGGAVGTPVRAPVTPEVAPEVLRLLPVAERERTRAELMAALNLRDEKHFRERYLQAAIKAGLLEMTRSKAPRSSLQRYRLTDRGRALLARRSSS